MEPLKYLGPVDLTEHNDGILWIHNDIQLNGGAHILRWTCYLNDILNGAMSCVIEIEVEAVQKSTVFVAVHINDQPIDNADLTVKSLSEAKRAVIEMARVKLGHAIMYLGNLNTWIL